MKIKELLEKSEIDHPIHITSGEGEYGTTELYTGKRTERAIKMRLTKESCGGDRWARASIFSHQTSTGEDVGYDVLSGEREFFPELD